jgi:hypothetical protein
VRVYTLYKIEGHGYMLYGSVEVIRGDMTMGTRQCGLGNHTLKYSFAER